MIIRVNRKGAEGNAILDRTILRDKLCADIKDVPNDFPVDFRDKIQFWNEVWVVSKQMRKVMLGGPRHVHVPKGFANYVLDNGIIFFSLKAYPKVRHGKIPFHASISFFGNHYRLQAQTEKRKGVVTKPPVS
mgnify:CR=1 FL=1